MHKPAESSWCCWHSTFYESYLFCVCQIITISNWWNKLSSFYQMPCIRRVQKYARENKRLKLHGYTLWPYRGGFPTRRPTVPLERTDTAVHPWAATVNATTVDGIGQSTKVINRYRIDTLFRRVAGSLFSYCLYHWYLKIKYRGIAFQLSSIPDLIIICN